MTIQCQTLIVTESGYTSNSKIRLDATCDQTISTYQWLIDNNILSDNTQSIIIDLSTLSLGLHNISLRSQVDCGIWSNTVTKQINIIACQLSTCDYNIS